MDKWLKYLKTNVQYKEKLKLRLKKMGKRVYCSKVDHS